MAAFVMKVVDKSKEQMAFAKEYVKQTAVDTKQHVDDALIKVHLHAAWYLLRGQTWSEPLGKACYVTGSIVQGLGNFLRGLGIVGGALSLGGMLLNPKATMNDLRREQETGCIYCC